MSTDASGQLLKGDVLEGELPPLPADRDWPRAWQASFLRALSILPDITSACRIARVGRSTAYDMRQRHADFAEAWDEAVQIAHDFVQRQAHTWITTGVPVRSSRTVTKTKRDAAGNTVETTTETVETQSAERSAVLMIFWLKAWHPERYRWVERVEASGPDGGPVQVESVERIDAQIAALAAELAQRAGGEPVPIE